MKDEENIRCTGLLKEYALTKLKPSIYKLRLLWIETYSVHQGKEVPCQQRKQKLNLVLKESSILQEEISACLTIAKDVNNTELRLFLMDYLRRLRMPMDNLNIHLNQNPTTEGTRVILKEQYRNLYGLEKEFHHIYDAILKM